MVALQPTADWLQKRGGLKLDTSRSIGISSSWQIRDLLCVLKVVALSQWPHQNAGKSQTGAGRPCWEVNRPVKDEEAIKWAPLLGRH